MLQLLNIFYFMYFIWKYDRNNIFNMNNHTVRTDEKQ